MDAEVDDHEVALDDAARAGSVVRHGAVGARRDDGLEGGALGAEATHGGVELEAELGFGGLLEQAVAHRRERRVGHRAGGLDAGHLARVLGLAQAVDQGVGGHQLGVGEPVGVVATLLAPA